MQPSRTRSAISLLLLSGLLIALGIIGLSGNDPIAIPSEVYEGPWDPPTHAVLPVIVNSGGETVGSGSGVMIAPRLMLTAAHVMNFSDGTFATVEGRTTVLLKIDKGVDLALVWVEGKGCPCLPVAEALPLMGSAVYAVGFPLLSQVKVQIRTDGLIQGYIREDHRLMVTTQIAPGNSGGALIQDGGLVGIMVEVGADCGSASFMSGCSAVYHLGRAVDTDTINRFLTNIFTGPGKVKAPVVEKVVEKTGAVLL